MLSIKKCFLFVLMLGLAVSLQAQSTDTFNIDETYTISADGIISLSSDDADVTIVGSDRPDVRVEVHYKLEVTGFSFGSRNKFDMEIREQDGDLIIEEQPRDFDGITFGSTSEEYTIRIEAPQSVSLVLDGDDEKYEISEMNGRINIDADDTDVRLEACKGNKFSFNLDDGSIEMDEGRGSLAIDVDDGQANIQNGRFDQINLDSDDGDFTIYTRLSDDGTYNFDMDDGDLAFYVTGGGGRFNIRHDDININADQAFRRTVDEENETEFELTGGTATIRMDVDDADIELHKAN